MNISEYKEKQNNNFKILCELVELQLEGEDTNFLFNMRKISELLMWKIYDEGTDYHNIMLDIWKRNDERTKMYRNEKDKGSDLVLLYEECFEKLSNFIHYQTESDEVVSLTEIEKMISIINRASDNLGLGPKIIFPKNKKGKILSLTYKNVSIRKSQITDILSSSYILPMYQREFKWTEKEIIALFDDIRNKKNDLGIIYKSDSNEIVDGQQRIHAIYIISEILNNICKEVVINIENFKFSRNREVENWRGTFKLFKEEISKSILGQGELHAVYVHMLSVLGNDEKILKRFENSLKKSYFFVRVIKSSQGSYYFNKINESGVKLNEYENLLSWLIHDNINDKAIVEKIELTWDLIDRYSKSSSTIPFVERILKNHKDNVKKMDKSHAVSFFEGIAKIVGQDVSDFLTIDNVTNISGDNFRFDNFNFLEYVYREIELLHIHKNKDERSKILIKEIFSDNTNKLPDGSEYFIIEVILFILNKFIVDKDISKYFEENLVNIPNYIKHLSKVGKIDQEIFNLINSGKSEFLVEQNGQLLGYNNININNRNQSIDLFPLKLHHFVFELLNKFNANEICLPVNNENLFKNFTLELSSMLKNREVIKKASLNAPLAGWQARFDHYITNAKFSEDDAVREINSQINMWAGGFVNVQMTESLNLNTYSRTGINKKHSWWNGTEFETEVKKLLNEAVSELIEKNKLKIETRADLFLLRNNGII